MDDVLNEWHQVDGDALGASDVPEVFVARRFAALWIPSVASGQPEPLIGVIVFGDADEVDLAAARSPWFAAHRHHRGPLRMLADHRAWHIRRELIVGMPDAVRGISTATTVVRGACIVAEEWWVHLIAGVASLMPEANIAGFLDADAAWAHIGANAFERERIERLGDFLRRRDGAAERVWKALMDHPRDSIAEVARRLGLSPRSLQRSLNAQQLKFSELRDRVRATIARRRLESGAKIAVVAQEIGFASVSHFITWYKRHHGQTPGQTPGATGPQNRPSALMKPPPG